MLGRHDRPAHRAPGHPPRRGRCRRGRRAVDSLRQRPRLKEDDEDPDRHQCGRRRPGPRGHGRPGARRLGLRVRLAVAARGAVTARGRTPWSGSPGPRVPAPASRSAPPCCSPGAIWSGWPRRSPRWTCSRAGASFSPSCPGLAIGGERTRRRRRPGRAGCPDGRGTPRAAPAVGRRVGQSRRPRGIVHRRVRLPRPAQDPFDVWLGGNAPAALERCGRLGDGWIPALCTPARRGRGEEGDRRGGGRDTAAPSAPSTSG